MRLPLLIVACCSSLLALTSCSNRDTDADATAPASSTSAATREPTAAVATRAASSPSTTVPPAGSPVAGTIAHDGTRTMELIRRLSVDIGPRVSGTEGEEKAVDLIATEFKNLGYDVEVQDFQFESGGFAEESVSINGVGYASRRFNGSGSGAASAAGMYVGLADAAGLAGKTLAGMIAVADRGTLTFTEKYTAVKAAGAIGLVIINSQDGLIAGRIDPAATIPVIGIGREDGAAFKAAVAAGSTIDIKVDAFKAKNVLAKADPATSCRVLVGGHHDSVPNTPGATDNASGAAMVLELARAFAVDGLDRGLCFATFGAEESGLYGSAYLASLLKARNDLPDVYLNLDVTGTGKEIEVIGTQRLIDEALDIADDLRINAVDADVPAGTSSDHASFEKAGVDVVYLATDDYSKIHTPADTIDTINADLLEDTGDLAYALIVDFLKQFARG